jgi:uracil-DNA glycosylase
MPVGGVMVVGQDFYNVKGYMDLLARGRARSETTWRPLERVLKGAGVPLSQCFFTNLIVGLRETDSAEGRSPAFDDGDFIERCLVYFRQQLQAQQPRLVLTLGLQVPQALAPLSAELRRWSRVTSYATLDMAGSLIPCTTIELPHGPIEVTVAALTHPSKRHLNVGRRRYNGLAGDCAESAMFVDALNCSGLSWRPE